MSRSNVTGNLCPQCGCNTDASTRKAVANAIAAGIANVKRGVAETITGSFRPALYNEWGTIHAYVWFPTFLIR